jgi:dTDP-4-dehydrorhamnose reductase
MKVVVTGAKSNLGSKVLQELNEDFYFFPIGRRFDEEPWELGMMPNLDKVKDVGAVLHFAWSLKDRENDFHLNVGGTTQLAQWAKALEIPFVFISSIAADGRSNYGKSKLEAEKRVAELGGTIVRVGLVLDSNKYIKKDGYLKVNLIPKLDGSIKITSIEELSMKIKSLLETQIGNRELVSSTHTFITNQIRVQSLFEQTEGLNIKINTSIIEYALRLWARFSLIGRNYEDSYKSLKSTLVKDAL